MLDFVLLPYCVDFEWLHEQHLEMSLCSSHIAIYRISRQILLTQLLNYAFVTNF